MSIGVSSSPAHLALPARTAPTPSCAAVRTVLLSFGWAFHPPLAQSRHVQWSSSGHYSGRMSAPQESGQRSGRGRDDEMHDSGHPEASRSATSGDLFTGHRHRQMAESFGAQAARYDRTRPNYPEALVQRIIAASPGREVLDVGCGTGTAARQFQAAGCAVVGIEPDARMAEFARGTGVEVEVATLEAWEPAGRQFDAVIAGTAWHWVDPVAGAAKAAQVLRPGGLLAPFHHVFQMPPEILDALASAYHEMAGSPLPAPLTQALTAYQTLFAKTADGMRQMGKFSEPEQWQFGWDRTYTTDEWLDQLPSQPLISLFPPDEVPEILQRVGAAINATGGSFTMRYTAVAVTASRTSAP
jgi:SAM-dependent methyltransferase